MACYSKKYNDLKKKLEKIIHLNNDGSYNVDTNYFNLNNTKENLLSEKFYSIFGKGRKKGEKLKTIHYQLAASLQKIVENTIINMIFNFNKKLRFKNICLGGGVFMNSVMNGKIAENFSNNEIFILYAPDDSGNSIGVLYAIFPLKKYYL